VASPTTGEIGHGAQGRRGGERVPVVE
jgi:hypothetical protein